MMLAEVNADEDEEDESSDDEDDWAVEEQVDWDNVEEIGLSLISDLEVMYAAAEALQ